MKNILIIIPNLNNLGGTERATSSLANILCSQHNVTVLSLTEKNNQPFFYFDPRVNLIYIKVNQSPAHSLKKIIWLFKCNLLIRSLIKKNKINTVIGMTHNINCLIALLNQKSLDTIGCEHIDFNSIPYSSKLLIKKLYPKLTAVVVLSPSVSDTLRYLNDKIAVIPNSLPFDCDRPSNLTAKRIIMVGRLSEVKGYERVIPLSKYLSKNFPDWRISIFGDGELRKTLNKNIIEHKLSNIELQGTTKEIMKEYVKSSILLSTSHAEAFGMMLLEAMHCGIPIVSYKNQGAEVLIESNSNGFIVESTDELIDRVTQLILDKQLRVKLGEKGVEISSSFKVDAIKQKWLKLIDSL